ncbi:hypothetical protein EDB86DRAFT_2835799 [Lactarius hatsudake]|nr:hypothetical protein EDB86DRAFT_2835799 [Lactarius hatsudake]
MIHLLSRVLLPLECSFFFSFLILLTVFELPSRAPTGVPREPLPRHRNKLGFGQCIKSLTAASALSLWPSPPPLTARRSTLTPTLSQHARAAMSRHARPTTTLARRVRVPTQDTADSTPRRIKGTRGYSVCHTHHHLPGGPCMTQPWTTTATTTMTRRHCTTMTTAKRHRHDGDDGEATSPQQ